MRVDAYQHLLPQEQLGHAVGDGAGNAGRRRGRRQVGRRQTCAAERLFDGGLRARLLVAERDPTPGQGQAIAPGQLARAAEPLDDRVEQRRRGDAEQPFSRFLARHAFGERLRAMVGLHRRQQPRFQVGDDGGTKDSRPDGDDRPGRRGAGAPGQRRLVDAGGARLLDKCHRRIAVRRGQARETRPPRRRTNRRARRQRIEHRAAADGQRTASTAAARTDLRASAPPALRGGCGRTRAGLAGSRPFLPGPRRPILPCRRLTRYRLTRYRHTREQLRRTVMKAHARAVAQRSGVGEHLDEGVEAARHVVGAVGGQRIAAAQIRDLDTAEVYGDAAPGAGVRAAARHAPAVRAP